jgi:hypothetical protein
VPLESLSSRPRHSHPTSITTFSELVCESTQRGSRWLRVDAAGIARGVHGVSRHCPIPSALVNLCFNCLAGDHVAADYRFPSRCLRCRCVGHRAHDCKRGRPPARAVARGWGALHRRLSRRPPSPWPRRHHFGSGANQDSDKGGDPQLGPGWGPTFQHAPLIIVGEIHCPLLSGSWSFGPRRLRCKDHQLLTSGRVSSSNN